MPYSGLCGAENFVFGDLKTLLAAASPRRSGDELAGHRRPSLDAARVAARFILADLPLKTFLQEALIPYEADEVTRLIVDSHDPAAFAPVASMTVGELRDHLLSYEVDAAALSALAPGLTPEMAAAVSKLMRNQDLIAVARKCRIVTAFRKKRIGLEGRLSTRLQPNHPADDPKGIAAAVLDGLAHGAGDAVIGINPASDNVQNAVRLIDMLDEIRQRYAIPTQTCVLTHVTNALEIMSAEARRSIWCSSRWRAAKRPIAVLASISPCVAPQPGFLHQRTPLDTLGVDEPETECRLK